MFTYKFNSIVILYFSILNKSTFILNSNSTFRNKRLNITVVLLYVYHYIIDSLLINLQTTLLVHFSTRHFIVIEVPIRHERSIWVRKTLFCFHTTWLIIVNAKNISSIIL